MMTLDLKKENTDYIIYDFEGNVEITIVDHETTESVKILMPNKIVEIFKKFIQNEAEPV